MRLVVRRRVRKVSRAASLVPRLAQRMVRSASGMGESERLLRPAVCVSVPCTRTRSTLCASLLVSISQVRRRQIIATTGLKKPSAVSGALLATDDELPCHTVVSSALMYASDNRQHCAWLAAEVARRRSERCPLAHPPAAPGRSHVSVREGTAQGGKSRCGV